jgi:hypothetical protein
MNTELKQRILDILNDNIYQLRLDKQRGIESNSPAAHVSYGKLCDTLMTEAEKTRDEFLVFCG